MTENTSIISISGDGLCLQPAFCSLIISTIQGRDRAFPGILGGQAGLWTMHTRKDMCKDFLELVEWKEKENRVAELWLSGWDWSRSSLGFRVRTEARIGCAPEADVGAVCLLDRQVLGGGQMARGKADPCITQARKCRAHWLIFLNNCNILH